MSGDYDNICENDLENKPWSFDCILLKIKTLVAGSYAPDPCIWDLQTIECTSTPGISDHKAILIVSDRFSYDGKQVLILSKKNTTIV